MPRRARSRIGRTKNTPRDLEQAVYDLGIDIYKVDDDEVHGWCPKHVERTGKQDRHPSWSVNRDTGFHNCFSCGYKGTFLYLVTDLLFDGRGVFDAARWVRSYGIDLDKARNLPDWDERHADIPEAQQIDETRLALYVDPPAWALQARNLSLEACRYYGVLWDQDRERWIIPIRKPSGELMGWQKKAEDGRYFRNYPEGVLKSHTLFGLQQFPLAEPAILLESPLDVVRLYTMGWEGGLSSYGAAVSDLQMQLIREVTDEMIVALDNDTDGRKYAEILRAGDHEGGKLVRKPWSKRINMRFFEYGECKEKDIGDMDPRDVERGLYEAQHAITARLGAEGVQRRTQGLPGGRGRANARPWKSAGRLPTRRGQNATHVVRRGGATRGVR